MDALRAYRQKRDFSVTPEPSGGHGGGAALRYSVQMHDATRLHWDLRLEWNGVLLSWAVTRGPSADPADKRLAVRTEDHPFDYLTFEGAIPAREYGAGTVMLWDLGWWQPFHDVDDGLAKGHLHFALHGRRGTGAWSLVRMKGKERRENWLMIKEDDAAASRSDVPLAEAFDRSILTNRTLAQIAAGTGPEPFEAARKGATPRFRKPQLAQLVDAPPEGEDWLHEVKLDGYRAQIAIGKGGTVIRTRSGQDWSDRFAELLPPLTALPCDTAVIDGEIVAGAGLQGFSGLQAAIKAGGPFLFYAFDLLSLDGHDLSGRPLEDRRDALEKLLTSAPPLGPVRLSPAIQGDATEALGVICEAGGEGLISKRRDAAYRAGRSLIWQKTKCIRRAEFLICGWQPSDKRGRRFSSLLLATRDEGQLVYRGKVGTGFDDAAQDDLMALLQPLARTTAPLAKRPAETRGARWVEPVLVAEIAYAELTADGLLRHARFVGLREDKPAPKIAMDVPKQQPSDRPQIAGIGISNPDRIIFPRKKITKLDIVRYYDVMAERILPTLAGRPASLVRLPEGLEGERFFQKHLGKGFPGGIRSIKIEESSGKIADYLHIVDASGLVGAAQMGTVEFHPWGARSDRLDRPERLVFDLDPDEGLGFPAVRSAAMALRDRLGDLGLASWPLLSGGKGIHVIVPLRRTASWDTAKLFAQLVATVMTEDAPDHFTATMSKARRKGRIFIDWLRNDRGSTAIAPFSLRAREGAPVAVPVSWDELRGIRSASAFSLPAAMERDWTALEVPEPVTLSVRLLERLTKS
ncbi:DNA ligase D [Falsirhodobacter deserti]|uniref:DNA ligase D n=1 Tax=Falsirhodobacter deserti TaxID=1365611 RepID=UPI000FE41990|nr:DNA ligase D [Falsirhodobacter deserti]